MKYLDSKLSAHVRAKDLLSNLSLKEKVAQLRNLVPQNKEYCYIENNEPVLTEKFLNVLRNDGVGSLQCLTRADFWTNRNKACGFTKETSAKLANAVQKIAIEASPYKIPLILFDDCRHGLPGVDSTVFPVGMGQASTWNRDLMGKLGSAIGTEMRSVGVTGSIGPNLNLARDPRWSRMEETYGEDPYLSGEMGYSYIKGLQGEGEDNSLKAIAAMHFVACMGDSENGLDGRPTNIGWKTANELFMPFAKGIKAGARCAMASYTSIEGVPCHGNKELLTDLMRDKYGFQGFIESDANGVFMMQADYKLHEDMAYCVAKAINAGLNVDLYCSCDTVYTLENVKRAIDKGWLKVETIDKLVYDVLKVKFELGLFENPYVDEKTVVDITNSVRENNKKLALEVARESIILLENKNNILPLCKDEKKKIALIGPHADDIYNLLGDYTPFVEEEDIITPLKGLKKIAEGFEINYARGCNIKTENIEEFNKALAVAKDSDIVIMTVGGSSNRYGQEFNAVGGGNSDWSGDADCGEGYDRATLEIYPAQLNLWSAIKELNKPMIGVLVHGRTMCINEVADTCDALIDVWYPGESGGLAIAEVIFGLVNPSGKLTVSVPRHAGQLPVYYNAKRTGRRDYLDITSKPLYEFGYGLSYTSFEYSNISIKKESMLPDESTSVKVTVTNTGDCDGYEVAELYVTDQYSEYIRPDRELRDFKKVFLKSKESAELEFIINGDTLGYFGYENNWCVEPGEFIISIGGNQSARECCKLKIK